MQCYPHQRCLPQLQISMHTQSRTQTGVFLGRHSLKPCSNTIMLDLKPHTYAQQFLKVPAENCLWSRIWHEHGKTMCATAIN